MRRRWRFSAGRHRAGWSCAQSQDAQATPSPGGTTGHGSSSHVSGGWARRAPSRALLTGARIAGMHLAARKAAMPAFLPWPALPIKKAAPRRRNEISHLACAAGVCPQGCPQPAGTSLATCRRRYKTAVSARYRPSFTAAGHRDVLPLRRRLRAGHRQRRHDRIAALAPPVRPGHFSRRKSRADGRCESGCGGHRRQRDRQNRLAQRCPTAACGRRARPRRPAPAARGGSAPSRPDR